MSTILQFPKKHQTEQPPERKRFRGESRFIVAMQRNFYQHDEVCGDLSIDQAVAIQKALSGLNGLHIIVKFQRMTEPRP